MKKNLPFGNLVISFIAISLFLSAACVPARCAENTPAALTIGAEGEDSCPRWSPDGARIVFSRKAEGRSVLMVMNSDGSEMHRLTESEKGNEVEPSWMPDGSGIVYAANPDGNYDLFMMNINDGYSMAIAETPANERSPSVSPVKYAKYMMEISYAASKTYKIAYSSDESTAEQIWVMDADGGRRMQLTKETAGPSRHPAWTADGRMIAFDVFQPKGKPQIRFVRPPEMFIEEEVLEKSRYAGDHTRLSLEPAIIRDAFMPAPAPNGKDLLFVSERGGGRHVWMSALDGTDAKQVTSGADGDECPAWDVNGRGFIFTSAPAGMFAGIKREPVDSFDSDILNLAQMKPTAEEMAALKDHGFFLSAGNFQEFPDLYESGAYENIPAFVTTDSILHLYHIFFDYTLRRIEVQKLYPELKDLTAKMLAASLAQVSSAHAELRAPAARNAAFFAVAARMLELDAPALPKDVAAMADAEFAAATAHGGPAESAAFSVDESAPVIIDYSQFIPRGHYTRSPELSAYFMAMMWYGQARFMLAHDSEKQVDSDVARIALLVSALESGDGSGPKLWESIYFPATFLVGSADAPGLINMRPLVHEVFGEKISAGDIANKEKLAALRKKAAALPRPAIAPALGHAFLFMPQRFTIDAEVIQHMVYDGIDPDVGTIENPRRFAKGLDVMAALGSGIAKDLLIDTYHEDKYKNFAKQLGVESQEFAGYGDGVWGLNIYNGWLDALRPLLAEKKEPYPLFMRNRQWGLKSLNTALGSWTELKHDTILYGMQPYAAEGGGEWSESAVPREPVGYVEPEAEVYARLAALSRRTREGLSSRGLMPDDMREKFSRLESLIFFLKYMADKELAGLSADENDAARIKRYGADTEALMLSVAEGVQVSIEDKHAAIVADVQTSIGPGGETNVLEEATGDVDFIFTLVDMGGWRQICRGAVYSYYEFAQPAADRMTDKMWQEKIDSGPAPDRPVWMKEILLRHSRDNSGGEQNPESE